MAAIRHRSLRSSMLTHQGGRAAFRQMRTSTTDGSIQKTSRVGSLIGVILLAGAFAMGCFAYVFYVAGSPSYGNPLSNDGDITPYLPPGVVLHTTLTTDLNPKPDSSEPLDSLFLEWTSADPRPFIMIFEFDEEPRSASYTARFASIIAQNASEDSRNHLVAIQTEPAKKPDSDGYYSGSAFIELTMRARVAMEKKERIYVDAPGIYQPRVCQELSKATAAGFSFPADNDGWSGLDCPIPDEGVGRQTLVIETLRDRDLRPEHLTVEPRPDNERESRIVWGSYDSLNVRGSLTDIEVAAHGQAWIFLAGAAVGLAGGLLVLGLEHMVLRRH